MISQADKTTIEEAINKLDEFIRSDSYMKLKNSPDTPDSVKGSLVDLRQQRSDMAGKLLEVYAKDIEENNAEFQKLIGEMVKVSQAAEEATDDLKKIADRIESAVKVAKALDEGIRVAAGLVG